MHIVVAGATGATGRLVVEQAVEAGHQVTALVRDASRFTGPASVRLIEADVVAGRGVDLPADADVVISALGKRSAKDRDPVCEPGVRHLLTGMQRAGLDRIVVISAGPVLRSGAGEGWFSRWVLGPVVRLWGRHIYPDLARMEDILREAGDWCRWTIIRPGYLTDAEAVGRYRLAAEANVPGTSRRPGPGRSAPGRRRRRRDRGSCVRDRQPMITPATRASWRQWCGLGAMSIALFMMSTDLTMLFIAQPHIGADLRPTATQALWIIHVGEFLAASLVITMGRLGDRIGRKRLLLIGITGYGIASALAAFAPTSETLIAARAALGVATATVTPSAMALLRSMFADPREFSRAFAILMTAFSAGMAFGPPMGGLLVEHFWWGALFLVNVPAALILLAVAPWTLPEFRDDQRVRLDLPSIALSVIAIMGVIYGIQQAAEGTIAVQHILITLIGLLSGWVFVRRQRRLDQPLLDLRLLDTRAVRVTLIALFFVMIAFAGPDVLVGPFLQLGLDLTALQAGMILFIPAALSIPATLLAPALKRRFGIRGGTALSLALAAVGFGTAAASLLGGPNMTTLVVLAVGLCLVALAGAAMTLLSELLITAAPIQRTGSMSALQDVSSGLGAASGIALLGTIGAIAYRTTLAPPPGLSDTETQAASDSPGAAASIADQLDTADRADFLTSIGESLSLGLQSALLIAAALTITLIALLLLGLRGHTEPPGTEETES